MPTLSTIILAGGRSRRMGRDKALLTMPNGQSLLGQTVQIAQQLTSHVVVVTPWTERYQSVLPSGVCWVQEQVLPELSPGPLSGFAQGWLQVSSDWCLLLACDMPYLQSAPLAKWWTWLNTLDHPTVSLAPCAGLENFALDSWQSHSAPSVNLKRWEPLCGFYHRNCLPGLNRYISAHQLSNPALDSVLDSVLDSRLDPAACRTEPQPASLSFQAWLKTVPVVAYTALSPKLLLNCNTPKTWAKVCQSMLNEENVAEC